jgi:hypothetical protein
VARPASYGRVLVAWRRRDLTGFRERAALFLDRYPAHPAGPAMLHALVAAALDAGERDEAERWARRLFREHPQSELLDDAIARLPGAGRPPPSPGRYP